MPWPPTLPDVDQLMQRPLSITSELAGIDFFKTFSGEHQQQLAQICAWRFVPGGQNITTQGQPGYAFVILHRGAGIITALDDKGRPRPQEQVTGPYRYGETSLLHGKAHDVSVRAVPSAQGAGLPALNGAEIITLDRRDLQVEFRLHRELWKAGAPLVSNFKTVQAEKQPYPWMQEDETLRWRGRGHLLWLLVPEFVVSFLWLVAIAMFGAVTDGLPDVQPIVMGIITVVALLAGGIIAYNYFDDYYAVTNRRVTRRDHVLLIYESRHRIAAGDGAGHQLRRNTLGPSAQLR